MTDITAPAVPSDFASRTRMHGVESRIQHRTGAGIDPKVMKRIDAAAQEFESVFLGEMIKPMFENREVDDLFGGGKGEEMFQDILVQEYGKKMSAAGGIGIASFVRDELIRQQEGAVQK